MSTPVKIGGWEGLALIDTGSSRTFASPGLINQIGGTMDFNYRETTLGVNGPVHVQNRLQADVTLNGYLKKNLWIYFVENSPLLEDTEFRAIIGIDMLNQLPPMLQDYQRGIIDFAPPDVSALEYFIAKHNQKCAHLSTSIEHLNADSLESNPQPTKESELEFVINPLVLSTTTPS